MKAFSIYSISLMFLGSLLFGFNWGMNGYFEPIVLLGSIFFLSGVVLSFIAIAKQEKGILKFVSLVSFFIILLLVVWFEPFQLIRMLTWLKSLA
ncbi:hypothetical protein SFC65_27460 [Priestia filamentosa]|uniref:hypothetical protein n=1 Tax=Priestia filamentosa TaxID=1402861 RepID=UPI0039825E02